MPKQDITFVVEAVDNGYIATIEDESGPKATNTRTVHDSIHGVAEALLTAFGLRDWDTQPARIEVGSGDGGWKKVEG